MDVEIDLGKSLEENASSYFEKSKLAKKKLSGLRNAMLKMDEKLANAKQKPKQEALARKKKTQWFQSFRWFRSSNGFLVVGGRDAKSNEAIVKRHLDKGDFFLHADIQGGSACAVKAEGKTVPQETLQEAALFAAVNSKAWQQGLAAVDVYTVSSEQVSKSAPSGEALGTGSFMIYGKRQWFRKTPLETAVGLLEENGSFTAMAGPPGAVKANCPSFFEVTRGKLKKSEAAKALLGLFEEKTGLKKPVSLDEILSALPGEGLSIRQ